MEVFRPLNVYAVLNTTAGENPKYGSEMTTFELGTQIFETWDHMPCQENETFRGRPIFTKS